MTLTLPKLLVFLAVGLFGLIGLIALFKESPDAVVSTAQPLMPLEIELDQHIQTVTPVLSIPTPPADPGKDLAEEAVNLPDIDRVEELFNKNDPRLPIVETITYKSHVSWLKGRPAWLSDYASHHTTSRHFIARSLNGKPDYFKQELAEGNRFNVLRQDKNFNFFLVVDTSRCKMRLYYKDLDSDQSVLIKTYNVGLGRLDPAKASGLLTPLGKYTLGHRIAIYKPKVMGTYQGKSTEMITVFGTRWIPFDKEIGETTAPAKGFGLHGTPWKLDPNGELVEDTRSIGKYESDGCIRLASPDIEELYAIIITRPTTIEIVRNFNEVDY